MTKLVQPPKMEDNGCFTEQELNEATFTLNNKPLPNEHVEDVQHEVTAVGFNEYFTSRMVDPLKKIIQISGLKKHNLKFAKRGSIITVNDASYTVFLVQTAQHEGHVFLSVYAER